MATQHNAMAQQLPMQHDQANALRNKSAADYGRLPDNPCWCNSALLSCSLAVSRCHCMSGCTRAAAQACRRITAALQQSAAGLQAPSPAALLSAKSSHKLSRRSKWCWACCWELWHCIDVLLRSQRGADKDDTISTHKQVGYAALLRLQSNSSSMLWVMVH